MIWKPVLKWIFIINNWLTGNPIFRIHQAHDSLWHQSQQIHQVWESKGATDAPQCYSDQQQALRYRGTYPQWPRCHRGLGLLRVLWPKDKHVDLKRLFAIQVVWPWLSAAGLCFQQTQPAVTYIQLFTLGKCLSLCFSLAIMQWCLTTQMGSNFKLDEFFHAPQSVP